VTQFTLVDGGVLSTAVHVTTCLGVPLTLNLADALRESARESPDKAAVIAGNQSLAYAELVAMVQQLAGGLARLGLHRGQHIAILLPNVPQFTLCYYAAHLLGCPVVPDV